MPIPVAYSIPVERSSIPTTKRRRMWGGDYPADWVGTDFRFFGGYNYGYTFPPGSRTVSGNSLLSLAKSMTTMSFSATVLMFLGCLTISIPQSLWLLGISFAYNEYVGWKGAVLDWNTLVEGRPTYHRMISGLSIVFNMFAAYPVYMWFAGSKIGWLAIIASGGIIINDIVHLMKQTVGTNNAVHFFGLAWGASFTYMIRRWITTSTWRLPFGGPMIQFIVGAAWTALNVAPYSGTALENYFEPVVI